MPPGYMLDNYNASVPFNPIATNGEPFPWHQLQLPDSIRPVRYTLTIHPNMTSIDVKGKEPCIFTNITNITVRTVRTVRFLVHMSFIKLSFCLLQICVSQCARCNNGCVYKPRTSISTFLPFHPAPLPNNPLPTHAVHCMHACIIVNACTFLRLPRVASAVLARAPPPHSTLRQNITHPQRRTHI